MTEIQLNLLTEYVESKATYKTKIETFADFLSFVLKQTTPDLSFKIKSVWVMNIHWNH